MHLSDDVLCVYTGTVSEQDGSYCIEIPDREIVLGEIEQDGVYRVALLSSGDTGGKKSPTKSTRSQEAPPPPVAEGDQRTVDIEDIGEHGDGIARVERGYVVIVPDTELGERVTIEITDVRENLGFAEVIEREDYYE